jgi:hypothetical protein
MSQATNIAGWTGVYGWYSYIFLHLSADLVRLDPAIPDEVK